MFLQAQVPDAIKWQKYELKFTSSVVYENPVQDVRNACYSSIFAAPIAGITAKAQT
jgi:hypothetical protein